VHEGDNKDDDDDDDDDNNNNNNNNQNKFVQEINLKHKYLRNIIVHPYTFATSVVKYLNYFGFHPATTQINEARQ